MRNAAVIYTKLSSFVKRDLTILSSEFNIRSVRLNTSNKFLLPLNLVLATLNLIFKSRNSAFIISQGGGYQSFVAAIAAFILRKPLFIVAIGTDCIRLPEINYGHFNKTLLRWVTSFSYQNATHIFPKHTSLIEHDYKLEQVQFQRQGIRAFLPGLKTSITPVENGYDHEFWDNMNEDRKAFSFLSVASAVRTNKRFLVKGIDLFLQLANVLPDYPFTLVGDFNPEIEFPKNVKVLRNLNREELRKLYNQHSFYLQLSRSEGFPNALCEAMLCGCIPIVTDVGGQSDIIGDTGLKLSSNNLDEMKHAIEFFMNENSQNRDEIRNRIKHNFTLENRKQKLLDGIKPYLAN